MKYIQSFWYHENNDPICLFYEIDNERIPVRKLEIYRDGRVELQSRMNDTIVENGSIPCVFEINEKKEFMAFYITELQFNQFWNEAKIHGHINVNSFSIGFFVAGNVLPKAYKVLANAGFQISKEMEYILAKKDKVTLGADNILELLGLFYLLQDGWKEKYVDDEDIERCIELMG